MRALKQPSAVAATRLPVLDGMRGFGVLLVVFLHFRSFSTGSTPFEHLYLYLGDAALVSLDVFFVLSGFLITGILLDSKGSPSYYLGFYVRRVLRIVPLYYGFLFAYFILLPGVTRTLAVALDLTARQQS
jgi:peptidoglycan/LPS O-acetylase OafA/YrhL